MKRSGTEPRADLLEPPCAMRIPHEKADRTGEACDAVTERCDVTHRERTSGWFACCDLLAYGAAVAQMDGSGAADHVPAPVLPTGAANGRDRPHGLGKNFGERHRYKGFLRRG